MGNPCSSPSPQTSQPSFRCSNDSRVFKKIFLSCPTHKLCAYCSFESTKRTICIICLRDLLESELLLQNNLKSTCFHCNTQSDSVKLSKCGCYLCEDCTISFTTCGSCLICKKSLSSSKFECAVCMSELGRAEMLTLNCEHYFCPGCISYHIQVYMKEKTRDLRTLKGIPCFNCSELIDVYVIKNVLTTEEFENYTRMLIETNECPKCKMNYFTDEQKIVCSSCGFRFCDSCLREEFKCKCDEEVEIAGNDLTACPGCRSLYAKDEGCNHVKCMKTGCGVEFCFGCSAFRSPALAHGNHYHRPQCRFYNDYTGNDDKFKQNCSRCAKRGRLCERPSNLKVPRRIAKDEIS